MKIATYNVNGIHARLPVLLRWLEEPGTRLVRLDGEWASPVAAAAAVADTLGGRSHPTRAQAS